MFVARWSCSSAPVVGRRPPGQDVTGMPDVVQVLQSLVVMVFAPLYVGVLAKAEAMVASKRGQRVPSPAGTWPASSTKAPPSATRLLGCSRRALRGVRLLLDRLCHRARDHQRASPAGFPGRPYRGRICPHPGRLRHFSGGYGHSQPLWGARCQPGHVGRQPRRAGADPCFLHGGSPVRVGQPVPDEPRCPLVAVRPRPTRAPARDAGLFHDRPGRERPHADREPERQHRSR